MENANFLASFYPFLKMADLFSMSSSTPSVGFAVAMAPLIPFLTS